MNFIEIHTGDFLDCVLTGSSSLFQENNDLKNIIYSKIKTENKEEISNLFKITIIINFAQLIGDFNRYLYLKEKNSIYYLLAIKENGYYKTYFDEIFNIQNILPLELNMKILEYSNNKNLKAVSKFYSDIYKDDNIYYFSKIEENANPINLVINCNERGLIIPYNWTDMNRIDKNKKIPLSIRNVYSMDRTKDLRHLNLISAIHNSIDFLPLTIKHVYCDILVTPKLSTYKNLVSFQCENVLEDLLNFKFPQTLKKLKIYPCSEAQLEDILRALREIKLEDLNLRTINTITHLDLTGINYLKKLRIDESSPLNINFGTSKIETLIIYYYSYKFPKTVKNLYITYNDIIDEDHTIDGLNLTYLNLHKFRLNISENYEKFTLSNSLKVLEFRSADESDIDLSNSRIEEFNVYENGELKDIILPNTVKKINYADDSLPEFIEEITIDDKMMIMFTYPNEDDEYQENEENEFEELDLSYLENLKKVNVNIDIFDYFKKTVKINNNVIINTYTNEIFKRFLPNYQLGFKNLDTGDTNTEEYINF